MINHILSIAFLLCFTSAFAQDIKSQPEFAIVNLPAHGTLFGVLNCKVAYSDSTNIDLDSLLGLGTKIKSYETNRLKVLHFFYNKGYELIGVTNTCYDGSCWTEYYFKIKNAK